MPKVTCVKCEKEMRPKENDATYLETTGPEREPYKVWSADVWACPLCEFEVVSGFGLKPVSGRWEDDFYDRLAVALANHLNGAKKVYYSHEK